MSGEPYELRCRKMIEEDEGRRLAPGQASTANRRQIRAMQDGIGRARREGRMTIADSQAELKLLAEMLRAVDDKVGPVGIRLAPADREFGLRKKQSKAQRQKRRSAKKARAAARPPKKSKARKRR